MVNQSDESRLIAFVQQIGLDKNPYLEVIKYLENVTKPASLSPTSQAMLKLIMVAYAIMWLQSFYLIYVRLKTGNFRLITVSRLGLWRLDVPTVGAITYFLFPLLVLVDLSLQLMIESGKRDMTDKIPLFGCKFLISISAAWGFLWACTCQCLSLFFDEKWSSTTSNRRRAHHLPRYIVVIMNVTFILVMTWIIPVEAILLCKSNNEYKMILKVLSNVVESLRKMAKDYSPETYNQNYLLLSLVPSREMLVHEVRMFRFFRIGFLVGLVDLCTLSILCAPLLKTATGAIRKRTAECTFALAGCSSGQAEQVHEIRSRVTQEYWTLLIHGTALYLTTLAYIPVLFWQVFESEVSILRSKTWITVAQMGMHGPYALTGNLIVLALNMQARRLLIRHRRAVIEKKCSISFQLKHVSCSESNSVIEKDG